MPFRKIIFENGQYYHVFNRSIGRQPIFAHTYNAQRFIEAVEYYQKSNPPIRFSIYRRQKRYFDKISQSNLVSILAFILMPNHFHFLIRQEETFGIKQFIQKLSNSFSHYYNLKHERRGPLFENTFRVVHVETETQLIHLSRYIHLNATTSFLTEDPLLYPYSSYPAYMNRNTMSWLDKTFLLNHFKTPQRYARFVLDNKDYQRRLKYIEHLTLD